MLIAVLGESWPDFLLGYVVGTIALAAVVEYDRRKHGRR